jgi:hypothetical protein
MEEETAALSAHPGASEQITAYYNANAVERDWSCDNVQMDGITRARVVSETSTGVVIAFQYVFQSIDQGMPGHGGCEGFGSRVATFDKGPGGVTLVSMTGEQR